MILLKYSKYIETMPIKRPPKEPSQREIQKIIEAGSPPAPELNAVNQSIDKEINFPMKIKGENAKWMEKARSKANLSRRSWVEMAIREKLEREGYFRGVVENDNLGVSNDI